MSEPSDHAVANEHVSEHAMDHISDPGDLGKQPQEADGQVADVANAMRARDMIAHLQQSEHWPTDVNWSSPQSVKHHALRLVDKVEGSAQARALACGATTIGFVCDEIKATNLAHPRRELAAAFLAAMRRLAREQQSEQASLLDAILGDAHASWHEPSVETPMDSQFGGQAPIDPATPMPTMAPSWASSAPPTPAELRASAAATTDPMWPKAWSPCGYMVSGTINLKMNGRTLGSRAHCASCLVHFAEQTTEDQCRTIKPREWDAIAQKHGVDNRLVIRELRRHRHVTKRWLGRVQRAGYLLGLDGPTTPEFAQQISDIAQLRMASHGMEARFVGVSGAALRVSVAKCALMDTLAARLWQESKYDNLGFDDLAKLCGMTIGTGGTVEIVACDVLGIKSWADWEVAIDRYMDEHGIVEGVGEDPADEGTSEGVGDDLADEGTSEAGLDELDLSSLESYQGE